MPSLLKYSKSFQLALISLIIAVIISITLVVIAAVAYQSAEVITALFFGPAVAAVFYMMSIVFFYKAKNLNRFGWARPN
jgi:amino acid permease